MLQNYTTYKTYYRLIKSIEDDPKVDKRKAARALARFMSLHPHNIAQKTEVMVEHFRHFTMHKIGGKAKAMVVTSSRLHAVRYKQAFDKYIAEKGLHGHQDAGGLLRHGDRPGRPGGGIHRSRHEQRHPGEGAAGTVRHGRIPGAPCGREIPDRIRPAAASHHVRGQTACRHPGGADALAAQPDAPGQGRHLCPRLCQ